MNEVSKRITKFIKSVDKEVILIIDEVDKSSNNQLFLSFLGMLRNKYLLAAEGLDLTFKSVILAGVHDVKSLKLKLRPDDEKKYNSPWTINDIDQGVKIIVKETNTLFDSLIKNLENNEELMNFVKQILINGAMIPFTISDNLINLGVTYGFFKEKDGRCVLSNRIFEQYIYNHLIVREVRNNLNISKINKAPMI